MPAKLCKRHRSCRKTRKLKTPDTGTTGRGNPDEVTLTHHQRRTEQLLTAWDIGAGSLRCGMIRERQLGGRLCLSNTCGESKKVESTAIANLPPSLCHPHLPTERWGFRDRLDDNLWACPGEEQYIKKGQMAWDRLLPVASPAGGNKLFTKGSRKLKGKKAFTKKRHFVKRYAVAKLQKAVAADNVWASV